MVARHQHGISGDAVTFVENHDVATNHFAAGDSHALALADHERARARQIPQRLQRLLAPALLDDGDGHGDRREAEKHQGLAQFAEHAIDQCRGDQQGEHRLADDIRGDAQRSAPVGSRQLVEPFFRQASSRLGSSQARREIWKHRVAPTRLFAGGRVPVFVRRPADAG